MLVQVTNLKAFAINTPDVYVGAPGGLPTAAVGGNVVNGLPHPFGWIGSMAANGVSGYQKTLAMHPSDLYFKETVNGSAQSAWQKWQQMIQAGVVALSVGAQADRRAFDEVFIAAV